MRHRLELWALKWLAGSPVPAHWIYPPPPPERLAARRGRLHIEIVSHCWRYSRLLGYQLTSLLEHPVRTCDVTLTVFYAHEDDPTVALLDHIGTHAPANVRWNWRSLPRESLFRRSIGRNLAARESEADWVWFTDCDLTFQAGCLDGLAQALQGRCDRLVFPAWESKTDVYGSDDLVQDNELQPGELLEPLRLSVATERFRAYPVTRATGPLQIAHGDVARALGYCANVAAYQRPAPSFRKAVEDRCYRWLLATDGTPIDVPGVCRVQHARKGRYGESRGEGELRRRVRALQHRWRHRHLDRR